MFDTLKRIFTTEPYYKSSQKMTNNVDMLALMQAADSSRMDSDKAMRCVDVLACVNLIAGAISQLPLNIYKKTQDGRESADKHPLYQIFKVAPNEYQTPTEFIEWVMTSVLLSGKACAYISRIGSKVVQLNPINPSSITEVWEDNGDHYFEATVNNKQLRLLPRDVFCIKAKTLDGKTAINPIEYAAASIGLSLKSVDYNNNFLGNGGRPSGILSTPTMLKQETADAISAEWKKKHSGSNTGNVAVLHGGFTYSPISVSAADAQLLEIMQFAKKDIAAIFGVPAYMINAEGSSNWGTGLYEQRNNFLTYTLNPWMVKICQAITRDLLNDSEKGSFYAEFNTNAYLMTDTLSRYQAYAIALGSNNNRGFLTVNEIRARENMPLVDSGDDLFTPSYGVTDNKNGEDVVND